MVLNYDQQQPNWQQLTHRGLELLPSNLQRIGIKLHHYVTGLLLSPSTNRFLFFRFPRKMFQNGSIKHDNGFAPTTLQERVQALRTSARLDEAPQQNRYTISELQARLI